MPAGLRDAGYGVGASRWEVTRDHVLPYAAPGILTGTVLAIARALGEAAPLILIGAITGLLPRTGLTEQLHGLADAHLQLGRAGRTPRARRSAGPMRRPRPASSCSPSCCSSTPQPSCSATASRRSASARDRHRGLTTVTDQTTAPRIMAVDDESPLNLSEPAAHHPVAAGTEQHRLRRRRPQCPLWRLPRGAGRDDRRAPARDHGLHRPVGLRQDDGACAASTG